MDSVKATKLFIQYANAMAYVDVETPDLTRAIGSAFHVGDGIFVTARHVVENNKIVEVKITEPVGISSAEFFRQSCDIDVSDDYIRDYDETVSAVLGAPPLFKHWQTALEITDGPYYSENANFDVAVFRVRQIHLAAGVVNLGIHWDDWIYRGIWHLSDAIILGYPPIPMTNAPTLVAAKAEINTFVVPRHAPAVHFVLSAIPRGGYSGGVAIHENGDALGVITSSLVASDSPAENGFMTVLSIEKIVECLKKNNLWPPNQEAYQNLRLSGKK